MSSVLLTISFGVGAALSLVLPDSRGQAVTACRDYDSARYDIHSMVTAGQECTTGIVHCTQNVAMICGRCEDGTWVCGG